MIPHSVTFSESLDLSCSLAIYITTSTQTHHTCLPLVWTHSAPQSTSRVQTRTWDGMFCLGNVISMHMNAWITFNHHRGSEWPNVTRLSLGAIYHFRTYTSYIYKWYLHPSMWYPHCVPYTNKMVLARQHLHCHNAKLLLPLPPAFVLNCSQQHNPSYRHTIIYGSTNLWIIGSLAGTGSNNFFSFPPCHYLWAIRYSDLGKCMTLSIWMV